MSLISTVEELRLYSPANAIDHIDSIAGFLDSSEHDFLQEKLGQELYASLTDYYRNLRNSEGGVMTFVNSVTNGEEMLPYAQLLSVCQRIICYDALARAIDQQAISVNGAGVNMAVSDDYGKADQEAIRAYKASCNKEAHAAVNRLLYLLESWVNEANSLSSATVPDASASGSEEGGVPVPSPSDEFTEIATLWRSSRFYFLAAGLIIPSANILQEYLNIYDSREKFITMLPDLRTIQEDILAPIFGEDFLDELVAIATAGTADKFLSRIIHKLRKVAARHLEARTMAIKIGDPRRETAHNEAVALVSDLSSYLSLHQADILALATVPDASASGSEGGVTTPSPFDSLAKAFTLSPLYKAPEPLPQGEDSDYEEQWENNRPGNAMFVTPSLS